MLSANRLPNDVREAKSAATRWFSVLKEAQFRPDMPNATRVLRELTNGFFEFHDGNELEIANARVRGATRLVRSEGAYYLECYVGFAHAGDARRAGSRRLVLKVDSALIKQLFLTTGHYALGTWQEIDIR